MALVTISGFPCSGKSQRALALKTMLEKRTELPVTLVNEEMLNLSVEAYDDLRTEKPSRANLLSSTIRSLAKNRITICDAMNYIKGFRYQLYCAAKEAGCRTLTIHVAAPTEKCQEWNESRSSRRYHPDTLLNLISRFEEPSYATRWDSPLIVLPWSDQGLPEDDILEAVLRGHLKPPNLATVHSSVSTGDYLQQLDGITNTVIQAVRTAQQDQTGSSELSLVITLPSSDSLTGTLTLPPHQTTTLPQLQRLRRQYITLNKQTKAELLPRQIASAFLDYLGAALQ